MIFNNVFMNQIPIRVQSVNARNGFSVMEKSMPICSELIIFFSIRLQSYVPGFYWITVSETLYCRTLIYYLCNDQRITKILVTIVEFPSQLVSMSSQCSIYWRLVVNCREEKVFQGFPKFHRSEYLIFQSVNITLLPFSLCPSR